MDRIELVTEETIDSRLEAIRDSYERLYRIPVATSLQKVPTAQLRPTESFLENDKFAIVFRKIIEEGYSVPIVVLKQGGVFFVVDGHHRSYINWKLGKSSILSFVLTIPTIVHARQTQLSLDSLEIKDVSKIEDAELRTWSRIVKLLKYYERLYDSAFQMAQMDISLNELVPTQTVIEVDRLYPIREPRVPIACLESSGRYYILDGHVRSLSARLLGQSTISAIVLRTQAVTRFGVEKNAENLGLASLRDIRIVGRCDTSSSPVKRGRR